MMKIFGRYKIGMILLLCFSLMEAQAQEDKVPLVVITDLYHPYQDPGDNLDLIMGYALPQVDLKAVILDITNSFRKDTADHPTLWKDPRGPREAGIIPVSQLNYIFDRNIPFAIGPLEPMRSQDDVMADSMMLQQGIDLFIRILRESKSPIEVVSFGSARVLAVAYNRAPDLVKEKISVIHLCAGTAAKDFKLGTDKGANQIPGGEWNVALDLNAFLKLLNSDLPIDLYPPSGINGAFSLENNNTYWLMPSMTFIENIDPRLRRYIDFAFNKRNDISFLNLMDLDCYYEFDTTAYPAPFHIWETNVWRNIAQLELVQYQGEFELIPKKKIVSDMKIISSEMIPVKVDVRNDGRFNFYQVKKSNIRIYYRPDPTLENMALQIAYPKLLKSFSTHLNE